ncbi:caffeic acid 3-O-methyltransferase-like isoform X2 [Iris pallida]|uniref:Caffeic acid 3-O-methyltransferase-like isoform X2 n=1 Tax=Iris pallida TaxID=29817 RepID=A0AAX6IEE6_IRIPA|nr:caffeic acid 3-O-methyltransferase-like isoform X2 [Iris pallida]
MGSVQDQPKHAAPSQQDDDSAAYAQALNLSVAYAVPMALKAAIELDVFEIIGEAGPGAQLSPAEIASRIAPNGGSAARAAVELDRILRFLASHGVLTCSAAAACGGGGGVAKRYGLAPLCKFYRKNEDGTSIVPLIQMNIDKVFLDSWQELKYGVVEGVVPFEKAHGMSFFEYQGAHPSFGRVFNQGMSYSSSVLLKKMLDTYTGFQGVKELVDVAGGVGTTLRTIVARFPHIKGTNFDLPHVISDAPPISGVEHVGGDMFVSVPRGDAIFLKFILHNWRDEACLKLLKNCFEALPESGKVIVMDCIVPEVPEASTETKVTLYGDLCMMAYLDGGKERTLKEFEFLAREAGFKMLRVACCAYGIWVMELLKQ